MGIAQQSEKSVPAKRRRGFTLIELIIVIAIIAILSSILLPALSKAKARAQGITCLNNTKQLTMAWMIYADDHNGVLAYNLGWSTTNLSMNLNWVNNVLDWNVVNSDNTNIAKVVETGLGPYASKEVNIYRCPSDRVLSDVQRAAGWSSRVRSYSMNAMIGDAGTFSQAGYNVNNPDYIQFFKYTAIPRPADIFVFLDEHPDSIDDGYFVNNSDYPRWRDLPASYHNNAGTFSFTDGHAESHRWRRESTQPPAEAGGAHLPIKLSANDLQDFEWVMSAMSVERHSESYHY
jgi:prepilin-type N-terminal cleavage/methylation domain-containing protein/prepilin-type processing-associated H-X9-DG protein